MSYEITNCSVCSDGYLGENICSRCKEAIARDEAMALEDSVDETHGPSREFMVQQACLNLHSAEWWRCYLTPEHEAFIRANADVLIGSPGTSVNSIIREYRKIAAKYREVEDTAANATEAA